MPGTPFWWLDRLTRRILSRQQRYDMLENYFLGDHPLPSIDQRSVHAFRSMQEMSRTNYSELVTMAPVERMQIIGFRFGATDSADEGASRFWQANEMDGQSVLLHLLCAVFGDAYVLVAPQDPIEDMGVPAVTVEDPRYCAVEMDPSRPGRVLAALKIWEDKILDRVLAVLYLPDNIYYFVGPGLADIIDIDVVSLTGRLLSNPASAFRPAAMVANTVGVVPMVRFQWRPTLGDSSYGEAESVLDIQDRINSEICNRLVISRAQAYKQRLITGIKLPDTKAGKKPPFDPGADMLWAVQDANAKIFEFKEADISQLLAAVRDDVGDMAAVTKTPPHYLLGEVVNVSGDALKAAETGLVSKVRQRMRTVGPSWEKVIRLCYRYTGDAKSTEQVANVLWADPESKSRAELADAMSKETGSGVPLQLAMARAGFTPEECAFAVAERRKSEARAAALQAVATATSSAGTNTAESVPEATESSAGTPDTGEEVT